VALEAECEVGDDRGAEDDRWMMLWNNKLARLALGPGLFDGKASKSGKGACRCEEVGQTE